MELLIIVGAVFAFSGIVYVSWYRAPAQRMGRQLAHYPQVAIAAATEGAVVRLSGRIRLKGPPLTAPLSGRPCAAWNLVIREEHRSEQSRHTSVRVDEHEVTDFYIEDQGGNSVEVRGCDTKLFTRPDHRLGAGAFTSPSEELLAELAERGHEIFGHSMLSAAEGIFEIGEEVVIAGTVRDLGEDPEHPGRRRLRLEEPPNIDWILASDHPKHRSAG